MLLLLLFIVFLAIAISFIWVKGINYMKENHPEYKGDDFLDWDNNHTEGEI